MFDNRWSASLAVAAMMLAALVLSPAIALATRPTPPRDPALATADALGGVAFQDGWCVNVTDVATDAWTGEPARITAAIQGLVRTVQVCHADETDAAVDVCASLGTSSGMTCTKDSGTRGLMSNVGECQHYQIARDNLGAPPPSLFLQAFTGATVTTCIDIFW